MRIRSTFATFAIASMAGSLLLSGCGVSSPGESDTASPNPEVTSVPPESPGDGLPSEEAPDQQESLPPQPSSTRDPVSAGPLEGAELNEAGVAWFGAFCSGIGEVAKVGAPDMKELDLAEQTDAVGTTYEDFGKGFDAAAVTLAGLDDDMNFGKADAFASQAIESLQEVSFIYAAGAGTVESGTYATEEDLVAVVNVVEGAALAAGVGDYGLSSLDESVFDAVNAQVPACASS